MTSDGVEVLEKSLQKTAEEPTLSSVIVARNGRVLISVVDGPTTLEQVDETLVWSLSKTKLEEIVDKLRALKASPRPGHHYVDITKPADTMILAKDEYPQRSLTRI